MTASRRPNIKWYVSPDYTGAKPYDPRTVVSRHTSWERLKIAGYPDHTLYSIPEPDNFTHAILDKRCYFIPDVNYQVWYWWDLPELWCSLFVTAHDRFLEFIQDKSPPAWCHIRNPKAPRQRISRIDYERHRNWRKTVGNDLTLEERLHEQGFFSSLIKRGASSDFIKNHAGWYTPGQYDFDEEDDKKELAE